MDASEVQEEPIEPAVIEDAPPVIPEIIPNTPTPIELEEKETKHTSESMFQLEFLIYIMTSCKSNFIDLFTAF